MKTIIDFLKSEPILRLLRILIFGGVSGVLVELMSHPDQWVPLAYVTVFTAVIAMIDKWLRDTYTK